MWNLLFQLVLLPLPWMVRRWLLVRGLGWRIHPTARVGHSLILVRSLQMAPRSRIGHLNFMRNHRRVVLNEGANIGHMNWISAGPAEGEFGFDAKRDPCLILGDEAAITSRHLIDCTDRVEIGAYAILAGYRSQILTHGIDVVAGRQDCAPVKIGPFAFVGTGVVVLMGARVPERSLVSAGSVVLKGELPTGWLLAGVPARPVRPLPADAGFMTRRTGRVT